VAKKGFGKWKILGTVGAGGQAQVYLVEDSTGQTVGQCALKPLRNLADGELRRRFEQEVRATDAVRHPNILRIYESDLSVVRPYYVAEYCEGGSLEKSGASLFKGDIQRTAKVLMPVLDALVAAHRLGVYHRDVKPANILIRKDGAPVVGDFGICHIEGGEPRTLSDRAMGSRHFTAPEMEAGRHYLGEPSDRTDVYSFGKVLYWMLSGGRIFDREDHRGPGNYLVDLLGNPKWEHIHMLLDKLIMEKPEGRLHSHELREALTMAENMLQGNFAPLKPSAGIQCRFCGQGKYEKFAAYDFNDPSVAQAYRQGGGNTQLVGLLASGGPYGTDVRVLRCSNCGHVEYFQFTGIKSHDWWAQ